MNDYIVFWVSIAALLISVLGIYISIFLYKTSLNLERKNSYDYIFSNLFATFGFVNPYYSLNESSSKAEVKKETDFMNRRISNIVNTLKKMNGEVKYFNFNNPQIGNMQKPIPNGGTIYIDEAFKNKSMINLENFLEANNIFGYRIGLEHFLSEDTTKYFGITEYKKNNVGFYSKGIVLGLKHYPWAK